MEGCVIKSAAKCLKILSEGDSLVSYVGRVCAVRILRRRVISITALHRRKLRYFTRHYALKKYLKFRKSPLQMETVTLPVEKRDC